MSLYRCDANEPMYKLKPCPFCGGEAELFMNDEIICNCGAIMTESEDTDVITLWNTRTPRLTVEEVEECVGKILVEDGNSDIRNGINVMKTLEIAQAIVNLQGGE